MRLAMSRSSQHGLRIVARLAAEQGRVPAWKISELTGVPAGCVPTIVAALSRSGILFNVPGSGGGCRLARDPTEINVLEVIEAIEGSPVKETCVMDRGLRHTDPPCALHQAWLEAEDSVVGALRSVSVEDLVRTQAWIDRPNPSANGDGLLAKSGAGTV